MTNGTSGGRDEQESANSPKRVSEILDGIESRIVQGQGTTPEQALLGCGLGIGALVLTAIVWFGVYCYYNPEFHEHPAPLPAILAPTPKPRIMHVFRYPVNTGSGEVGK